MSPEAQRIAIAEACGWKFSKVNGEFRYVAIPPNGVEVAHANFGDVSFLPDYLNDLNAMGKAEKACIVGNHGLFSGDTSIERAYKYRIGAFSSAAERAREFLYVLGKLETNK